MATSSGDNKQSTREEKVHCYKPSAKIVLYRPVFRTSAAASRWSPCRRDQRRLAASSLASSPDMNLPSHLSRSPPYVSSFHSHSQSPRSHHVCHSRRTFFQCNNQLTATPGRGRTPSYKLMNHPPYPHATKLCIPPTAGPARKWKRVLISYPPSSPLSRGDHSPREENSSSAHQWVERKQARKPARHRSGWPCLASLHLPLGYSEVVCSACFSRIASYRCLTHPPSLYQAATCGVTTNPAHRCHAFLSLPMAGRSDLHRRMADFCCPISPISQHVLLGICLPPPGDTSASHLIRGRGGLGSPALRDLCLTYAISAS